MPAGTYLSRQNRDFLYERQVRADEPYLVGEGPAEFSTSMALEVWPSLIWDTNLYYRDLGVSPRASREEIRKRYQDINGESSTRLTMIARTLLNPVRRRQYDLVPFGSHFFDEELEDAIRAQLAAERTAKISSGEEIFDPENLGDMDLDLQHVEDYAKVQTQVNRALYRTGWSHYLWNSSARDPERLQAWRRLLVQWMWHYWPDAPIRLSVGLHVGPEEVLVRYVGFRLVAFIHEDVIPNDVLACYAVAEATRQVHDKNY